MDQKRITKLSKGTYFLVTVVTLFFSLSNCSAVTPHTNTVDSGTTSLNLRETYYRTIEDNSTELVGKIGVALVNPTGISQVPVDYAFKSGDKFCFLISSNHDGFLYILHKSADNHLQQLWPQTKARGVFEIRSGQTYTVPPSPGAFIFDKEVGNEQFYIAVRSEPKAPKLGVLELGNKTIPTVLDPGVSENARTGEIEWIIRGDPFGERSTRNIIFDPGTRSGDLYRYFSAAPGDQSTKAMIQIILKHYN